MDRIEALAEADRLGRGALKVPEKAVLQMVRDESAAFYRRDYEGVARCWLHDENVRVIVSGPLVGTRITSGWSQLSRRMREGMRQFPARFDFDEWIVWENLQVDVATDMAWVCYDQIVRKPHELMLAPPIQHETKILKLRDGEWKLACLTVAAPAIAREDVPRIELDELGHVANINSIARERLSGHMGLALSGERVRARNRRFDAVLQREIRRVADHRRTHLVPGLLRESVAAVPLGTDEHSRPLYCWVSLEQEAVIISFDDDFLLSARIGWASSAYGLSAAQSEIAALLAAGMGASQIARQQNVSINTVRTQLRRMFTKTGAGNQAALLSVLLSVQRPV